MFVWECFCQTHYSVTHRSHLRFINLDQLSFFPFLFAPPPLSASSSTWVSYFACSMLIYCHLPDNWTRLKRELNKIEKPTCLTFQLQWITIRSNLTPTFKTIQITQRSNTENVMQNLRGVTKYVFDNLLDWKNIVLIKGSFRLQLPLGAQLEIVQLSFS